MLILRQVMRAVSALPFVVAVACFPEGANVPIEKVANMAAKTIPDPTSVVGNSAAPLPSVVVTNNAGKGIAGVVVSFTITAGDGSVTASSVKTDKDGVASTGWTYGMVEGDNILAASLATLEPVTFKVHTTGGPPKSMTKENDGQSAAVGDALAQPVSVVVLNGGGHPVTGASVTFTALNGSTVSGAASASSVATDANGRAQTEWTMGTVPGAYSLTAEVDGVATETFGATAVAGAPYEVLTSGDNQSGTVDAFLPNVVGLTVRDRYQNAVPNTPLTYSPQNGGSVADGTALVTDAAGQATAQWKLPTRAGTATLNFTAGSLSGSFTATANPGPAAKLEKMASSDNQIGNAGEPLTQAMSVTVRDAFDNALRGVTVTFSPAGGSVSPPSIDTNNEGQANTIWTLGMTGGATTLSVSAAGIADPVVFSATVLAPTTGACDSHGSLTIGRAVTGNLVNSTCSFPMTGTRADIWTLDLGAATPIEVLETSDDPVGDSYLAVYRGSYSMSRLAAFNDDLDPLNSNYNSRVHVLAGPGRLLVAASYLQNFINDPGWAYHLIANRWGGAVTACEVVYATTGTSSNQLLDNDDCPATSTRQHSDRVFMLLQAGETVTISVNSSAFDAKVEIEDGNATVLASDDNGGGGTNARLVYTVPASAPAVDQYLIYATSTGTAGGAYTLAINVTTPAGMAPSMTSRATTAPTYGPALQRAITGTTKAMRTP